MIGKPLGLWLGLAGLASIILFNTSTRVQALDEELEGLNARIVHEQETIQVLKAEWSLLNDPARLEKLAREHTDLRPTVAKQLATLDAVPDKVPGADAQPGPVAAARTETQGHAPAEGRLVRVAARAVSARSCCGIRAGDTALLLAKLGSTQ